MDGILIRGDVTYEIVASPEGPVVRFGVPGVPPLILCLDKAEELYADFGEMLGNYRIKHPKK